MLLICYGMMSEKNNNNPPRITSNTIAPRPPIADRTLRIGFLKLGFTRSIPLPKLREMLATIPNHPIIRGTTS